MITVQQLARAIEGRALTAEQAVGRGPGHGPGDTSLSVWLAPRDPEGFTVHSHANDDFETCRDYVRERLGLPSRPRSDGMRHRPEPAPRQPAAARELDPSEQDRAARALDIYREADPLWGSPAEAYLTRERRLALFEGLGRAVRYHRACPFAGAHRTPAMVALVRDVRTNEPRAIHRTALTLDGRKTEVAGHDRLTLGPVAGGAIKLTPDEEVTRCLGIGEGIESALSLRLLSEFGASPVWSLISANGIERLAALVGVESLWIAVDHDPAGLSASQACAERWRSAGAEAFLVKPLAERTDLNDMFRGRPHA